MNSVSPAPPFLFFSFLVIGRLIESGGVHGEARVRSRREDLAQFGHAWPLPSPLFFFLVALGERQE